jgi:ribosome recycling factor
MGKAEDNQADAEQQMKKGLESLRRDLSTIRTGRASPALVENLPVDYYGTSMPLNQIATVSAPDARLLLVQPWDRNALGAIEKGILKSNVGLTPTNDGAVIRLAIPALTEERRKDLARQVHKRVEEEKVVMRNVRREAVDHLRKLQKEKEVSQDDERRAQEQLQRLTDRMVEEVERTGQAKETEILEV